MFIVSVIV